VSEQASNILAGDGAPSRTAGPARTIAFEDAELVARCQKGDMQAFGSLVAKYQDRLFNTVYRLCNNRADAEELAQQAMLKALERIGQFRGSSKFYTWLFRIATNLAISHRRRAGRIRFHSMTVPDDENTGRQAEALTVAMAQRRQPAPEAAAMRADLQRRLAAAMDSLEDDFRLVVVLRDVEDMDYRQIANVVGVPVGTVKSRLHRARCILKDNLADLVG